MTKLRVAFRNFANAPKKKCRYIPPGLIIKSVRFAFVCFYALKSTITYAAETWCLKAKTIAKLNSTKMDFWRRSARISRKDKIRNTIIKQKMKLTRSLLDDIKTKQLQWYGHVQRMEEGRLPKEAIKWRPPGRRKRGRSKRTWAEGIRRLMGEKGLMEEDWTDKSNWRKKTLYLSMGAGRCENIVQPAK